MEEDYKLKMAIIAGASHALKFKEKNPHATEQEVLQHITEKTNEILSKIEDEDD
ncbi:MAG: hypothetical protein KJ718_02790 [Nanoarchaeota archaeon]|nr:hypothetical protein [Nanoarchaeota archaeon]MBU1051457.1 hypothetical protein [Nanoarchaeota archaeon]